MDIRKAINDKEVIAAIDGRIDTTTAPALEQELKDSYDSCETLILDFTDVEYISSAGLRVLLSAHKTMSKKSGMKLRNVSEDIMEIFEVTGFADILSIE
ncbi:STAS domain-containing protein [Ruminococcus flavefaciens]|uniref:STAS domain-containing protein n=1 Tax=Ruminococcus flavefaciens TaxID=1265 RepID=UPI0026E996D4|nr:STAS domain-containing protein [Ruminococcus flavefaciens]